MCSGDAKMPILARCALGRMQTSPGGTKGDSWGMSQPNFAENYLSTYVLASESSFWKTVNKHPSDLRVYWKMFASFFRSGHQLFRGTFSVGHFFCLPQPNSKPFHRAWLYFTKCAILLQCRPPSVANNLVSFSSKGNLFNDGKGNSKPS